MIMRFLLMRGAVLEPLSYRIRGRRDSRDASIRPATLYCATRVSSVSGLPPQILRVAPYVLLVCAYAAVRLVNLVAIQDARVTFDSGIYLGMSRLPLWSPRFWIGERPWTVPLAFKMLAGNTSAIMWF